jgi:hypothetical protein
MAVAGLSSLLAGTRPVAAACGTYVLVAGQVVVHELLPYQTAWRVLNEPQMKQLLTHRWSIDFAVVPPCDDCSCDGHLPSAPLPPVTTPASRDLPPGTPPTGHSGSLVPDLSGRLALSPPETLLPGHPFRIERPPKGS